MLSHSSPVVSHSTSLRGLRTSEYFVIRSFCGREISARAGFNGILVSVKRVKVTISISYSVSKASAYPSERVKGLLHPNLIISLAKPTKIILFMMKLLAALFIATASATIDPNCLDDTCIPTGQSCMNKDKACCGEDECFGYPFFKRCQPVPQCIPEWQDCDNGVAECCDPSLKCLANNAGHQVCMEETITPRTAPIPPPTNTNVTKIPGEEVKLNYACSTGDPHITTFDGLRWDCQGHGEHILFKSPVTQREVQARYTQMTSHTWSVAEGVVIQDEGATPRVQITMPAIASEDGGGVSQLLGDKEKNCQVQFFVNGVQRDLYAGSGDDGVEVTVEHGRTIHIKYTESGMTAMVGVGFWQQCFLQLCFGVPDTDPVIGILGSADGDVSNDWMQRDGTVVPVESTNSRIRNKNSYDYCQQNWCLTDPEDSLFYYNQAGKTFEDFQMCSLPYDTYIIDDIEDQITPEIQEFCGNDLDCVIDAVTGGGVEAARDAKIMRTGFLSQTCNKEGGECIDSDCCTGYSCVTLGGLTTPTCHADPEEPTCYPETATCSDSRPCCDGTTCEEHNNGEFYCKEIPPPCAEERAACVADSDCCGGNTCVGPENNKRCLALESVGGILFLPDMETCGYENQQYQCMEGAKCVRSAEGSRCTTLPQCWDEPWRPCADNLGYPGCCEDSGNVCQMKDNIKQCVPAPKCSEKLFPCEGEFSLLRVPCCEGLTCQWRGEIKLCVEPPPAKCQRTASTGDDHIDQDCTAEEPVCFNDDGSQPAVGEGGMICGFCQNDKEGDGIDIGCTEDTPRCVGGDGSDGAIGTQGSQCAEGNAPVCENKNWEWPRTGCPADKPACFKEGGWPIQKGQIGAWCGVCYNSKTGDDRDKGCTDETPRCVAADGSEVAQWQEGGKCVKPVPSLCRNSGDVTRVGPNTGCDSETPICAKASGWLPSSNQLGEFCAKCTNSRDSNVGHDYGCSSSTPLCVDENNNPVTLYKAGAKCVASTVRPKCYNNASGLTPDYGCSSSMPICTYFDEWTAPWKKYGDQCMKCLNNKSSDRDTDSGCTWRAKRCVAADNSRIPLYKGGYKCI